MIFAASAAFAQDSVNFDAPADARKAASAPEIQFDIPSQPLADALAAYGKAAGLEVFYDGSLAIGHRSTEIKGTFTPMLALQALLRGTGSVARATEYPGTVTIARAPRTAPPLATFNRYEAFFAVLQKQLGDVLCEGDQAIPGSEDIIFKFWVDPSGLVSHVEVLGAEASRARRHAIASGLQGLRIGRSPPPGLPQPVTMVIYPPASGEATGCPATGSRRAGN